MVDEDTERLVKSLEDLFMNPEYDDFVKQREELIKIIDGRSLDAEAVEYLFLGLEGKATNFAWTLSTEATATAKQKEQLKNHNYEKNAIKIIGDDFLKYREAIEERKKDKLREGGKIVKNKSAYKTVKKAYYLWQKESPKRQRQIFTSEMMDKNGLSKSTIDRYLRKIKTEQVEEEQAFEIIKKRFNEWQENPSLHTNELLFIYDMRRTTRYLLPLIKKHFYKQYLRQNHKELKNKK